MKKHRKQQVLKAWGIFKHNCPISKYHMIDRLREKAARVAFDLPEDVFTRLVEQSGGELEYIKKTDKSDRRHTRHLIRRGKISRYGKKKYHNREWTVLGGDKYLKKMLKEGK